MAFGQFAEPSRAAVAVAEMEGEALEKALVWLAPPRHPLLRSQMNVETMSLTLEATDGRILVKWSSGQGSNWRQ